MCLLESIMSNHIGATSGGVVKSWSLEHLEVKNSTHHISVSWKCITHMGSEVTIKH